MARKPHIHQIRGTNYTTREYCQSKGITDDTAIKKIQWRINTYTRNHTTQQTIEELDRLTLHPTHSTRDNTESGIRPWLGTQQERIKAQQENKETTTTMKQSWIRRALERTKPEENTTTVSPRELLKHGQRQPDTLSQQELLKDSEWMNSPLKTPPSYESVESMLGAEDPRLQNLEKIRETSRPNAIENAITQYAEAIQTVNRRKKELAEAQNALNRWAEVTTNLLNGETSSERTNRFNKVNNT
jgi:hypothetical protein